MQDALINKETDERLLVKNREILTTLFSNNPFESSQDFVLEGEFDKLGKSAHILRKKQELEKFSKQLNLSRLQHSFKSVKRNPENPYLINNLGLVYLNNKELNKAKKCFLRALKLDKDLRAASLNLASLYKISGEYDDASEI